MILKRDDLGRVRTPMEKRRMAVEEFKRSGLSARKFAQLIKVHYNTFWNWLKEQGMTAKHRRKGIKVIYWDKTGLWMMTKRLEKGTFSWPRSVDPGVTRLALAPEAFAMLTDGIDMHEAKMRPWYDRD